MICVTITLSVLKEKQNLRAFEEHFNILSFTWKTCKSKKLGRNDNKSNCNPTITSKVGPFYSESKPAKLNWFSSLGFWLQPFPKIAVQSSVTQAHTSSSLQQPQPAEPYQLSSPPMLTVVSLHQLPTLPFHLMLHFSRTKSFRSENILS